MLSTKACRTSYQLAKCAAKKKISRALSPLEKKFGVRLDEEDGKGNV